MNLTETTRLVALPVQFIEIPGGLVLKRGCTELRINGEGAADALQKIFHATVSGDATYQGICEQFAVPNRQVVRALIEQLVGKRFLIPLGSDPPPDGPESSLQIFYWHFGDTAPNVTHRLNASSVAVLGVNLISRQLAVALTASGVENFHVVDFPLLRNLRLFDDRGQLSPSEWKGALPLAYETWTDQARHRPPQCLVATSDFGGRELFRHWNKYCIDHDIHFLPVFLQDLIGYIGPLVVPRETACFECLRVREDSNVADRQMKKAVGAAAFESQPFIGFHPSMASVLGDISAFELTRFYGGVLPRQKTGVLIEVNLLPSYMTTRKVLKLPRCLICSSLNRNAPVQTANTIASVTV
jgi:bacteriocin biosynthesis cyclodehydratase domain-containing protein